MSDKKNTFFGATVSYDDVISKYYSDGMFSYFVFQYMINDGTKKDDYYTLALWAINTSGSVMNEDGPILLPENGLKLLSKKKVIFASVHLTKITLDKLYKSEVFDIGLKPIWYVEDTDYVSFEVYRAEDFFAVLDTLNPSPPAKRP